MQNEKSERELLSEINMTLQKLLAVNAIQGKTEEMQIKILSGQKLSSSEISELTGIPAPSVRKKWRKKSTKN